MSRQAGAPPLVPAYLESGDAQASIEPSDYVAQSTIHNNAEQGNKLHQDPHTT
jgi:hypothetical protein